MAYKVKFNSRIDRMFYKVDRENQLKKQSGKCFYCGVHLKPSEATLDHVIPLSKTNRWHSAENIVVACRACNLSKGNKRSPEIDPLQFLINEYKKSLQERTLLALWRLDLDPKGSFRKWKKFHQKNKTLP